MTSVLWLRRDLRRRDHPALLAAHEAGGPVLPLFVADPALVASAGTARLSALHEALRGVHDSYDGALVVRTGRPEEVVPAVVREVGATSVHVSAETTPYGRRRDERVEAALAALADDDGAGSPVPLVRTGSPYAVTPGRVRNGSGDPYKVFTPFSRAWRDHGWRRPADEPAGVRWVRGPDSEPLPGADAEARWASSGASLTGVVDEEHALERWSAFLDDGLASYGTGRDRPDLDATSGLSVHLKYGTVHPRTLLADVAAHPAARTADATRFVTELAWREFYADVLWHSPSSAWADLRPGLSGLAYEDPTQGSTAERFAAWCEGRTGYPFVDAGMRQLLREGWVHNRVRMVVASFLVKDLHVWWPHGARHFMAHLRDGDLASNSHGWQWVAGTGTDASPFFRVFNPVTQGKRFDPDGDYVRRYVPELAHVAGAAAHEPWSVLDGYAEGYPERVVDHAAEREEALRRYSAATA
ncbi:cryptochrome/photolyase family protein [Cellulomonas carbonis]|uniref:Deoxyribodipyrimidine photolyase n=1 Tax=Cellulomonas carbonis T26 TaxID=947969 RepID=A0A0A0BUM0_9CELL|nr:deoxyribodipyrimidine photo-lyase [Cellulomonas carbonis]KGM11387.1 deoxyribodipyrimidine photolyase [Cellulomonas carbonis T26]